LDEVRVALVRLGEEREMRVALRLGEAIVGDVDLAADDRLDAVLTCLPVELDHACERSVIRERYCRHLEALGLVDERRDPAGAVEDRVLGVDVKVDERRRHARRSPRDARESRAVTQSTGGPAYCAGPT